MLLSVVEYGLEGEAGSTRVPLTTLPTATDFLKAAPDEAMARECWQWSIVGRRVASDYLVCQKLNAHVLTFRLRERQAKEETLESAVISSLADSETWRNALLMTDHGDVIDDSLRAIDSSLLTCCTKKSFQKAPKMEDSTIRVPIACTIWRRFCHTDESPLTPC